MAFVVIGALMVTELLINEHTYKNTKRQTNINGSFPKHLETVKLFSPSAVC